VTTRDRVALAVAALGTIVSTGWAFVGARDVVALLNEGGGIFGSSTSVLENVLPFLLTLWLSGKVRNIDRTGQALAACGESLTSQAAAVTR
jgi:hypothetical protein